MTDTTHGGKTTDYAAIRTFLAAHPEVWADSPFATHPLTCPVWTTPIRDMTDQTCTCGGEQR